jgi:hypothetical protein
MGDAIPKEVGQALVKESVSCRDVTVVTCQPLFVNDSALVFFHPWARGEDRRGLRMESGGGRKRLAAVAIWILVALICFPSASRAGCPPWRGPSITMGPSGERLCAKHHDALLKATVYGPDPAICILVQPTKEAGRLRACSPNAVPFGVSRTKSLLYSRAIETFYCRSCERFVQARVRK